MFLRPYFDDISMAAEGSGRIPLEVLYLQTLLTNLGEVVFYAAGRIEGTRRLHGDRVVRAVAVLPQLPTPEKSYSRDCLINRR
jgi:hypothetical protein